MGVSSSIFLWIAETEADWYHTQVEQPLFDAGMRPGEVLELGSRFGAEWNVLADPALLAMPGQARSQVEPQPADTSLVG